MVRLPLICLFLLPSFCYADPIPKAVRQPVKIEGTSWEGKDSLGNECTFTFHKNGELEYKTKNGTYRNGTWKLAGLKLTWECNNRYAEYEGKVKKDEIEMEAHNIKGLKWTITIKPVKDDKQEK